MSCHVATNMAGNFGIQEIRGKSAPRLACFSIVKNDELPLRKRFTILQQQTGTFIYSRRSVSTQYQHCINTMGSSLVIMVHEGSALTATKVQTSVSLAVGWPCPHHFQTPCRRHHERRVEFGVLCPCDAHRPPALFVLGRREKNPARVRSERET